MALAENPSFNFLYKIFSYICGKVTVGTYNLQSVILNSAAVGLFTPIIAGSASGSAFLFACEANTQFLYHFKSKKISQLINGISSDLRNLLKYFIGTATLMPSNSVSIPSNFPTKAVL